MHSETKKLVKLMKKKRESEGLSVRKLSDKIGVSFSTLARIEREEGSPDNNTKVRILNWLGNEAKIAGFDFDHEALVHFRAAKNIEPTTVKTLLKVANLVKEQYQS